MLKIALKKHYFKPYFQKTFRGATAPRTPQMAWPFGLGGVSALRASKVYRRKWMKGMNKCTMYYMQQYFFSYVENCSEKAPF